VRFRRSQQIAHEAFNSSKQEAQVWVTVARIQSTVTEHTARLILSITHKRNILRYHQLATSVLVDRLGQTIHRMNRYDRTRGLDDANAYKLISK